MYYYKQYIILNRHFRWNIVRDPVHRGHGPSALLCQCLHTTELLSQRGRPSVPRHHGHRKLSLAWIQAKLLWEATYPAYTTWYMQTIFCLFFFLNTSATVFFRFPLNFMINIVGIGEHRVIVFLTICQKIKKNALWIIYSQRTIWGKKFQNTSRSCILSSDPSHTL